MYSINLLVWVHAFGVTIVYISMVSASQYLFGKMYTEAVPVYLGNMSLYFYRERIRLGPNSIPRRRQ